MYFIVLGGESVSTNKIGRPGTGALSILLNVMVCGENSPSGKNLAVAWSVHTVFISSAESLCDSQRLCVQLFVPSSICVVVIIIINFLLSPLKFMERLASNRSLPKLRKLC